MFPIASEGSYLPAGMQGLSIPNFVKRILKCDANDINMFAFYLSKNIQIH